LTPVDDNGPDALRQSARVRGGELGHFARRGRIVRTPPLARRMQRAAVPAMSHWYDRSNTRRSVGAE
jgi:hypothetical protein